MAPAVPGLVAQVVFLCLGFPSGLYHPHFLAQVAQVQVFVMDCLAIWTLMESLAMMEQVGFLICLYVL